MEIPKYIQNKIKQQNEACKKASKLEAEIENWCQLSGFNPYSKEYKEIKGRLVDAVAPLNADKIKEIANTIEYLLQQPTHVQIADVTIFPKAQAGGTVFFKN